MDEEEQMRLFSPELNERNKPKAFFSKKAVKSKSPPRKQSSKETTHVTVPLKIHKPNQLEPLSLNIIEKQSPAEA